MATAKRNRPYRELARFYDRLIPGVPDMNRHAREKVLGRRLRGARSACDLACGSGDTALEHAALVRGADPARGMDGAARLQARDARHHVRETIVHVCWTEAEIRRALRAAGFGKIRTFDGADVRPKSMGTPRGTDLHFVSER